MLPSSFFLQSAIMFVEGPDGILLEFAMKISVGSDHLRYELKTVLLPLLEQWGQCSLPVGQQTDGRVSSRNRPDMVQADISGKEEAQTAQAEACSVHGTRLLRISSV